ncbi:MULTISPECIES: tRNA pseudouridine(13) synthase TruD [Campylobacter]|uniref:tRNA pseudouridine(13) synthase TruD n=1 Tax=Campylobacter TaxID=194 RepID=UPI000A35750E|nr:tRNA pseudouridine(13) synthase TruD [Campylobacter sp. P0024]MCR8679686.1 tRNA pseudouridine(13) synthase TruD [Campylobacter sp. RM19072]
MENSAIFKPLLTTTHTPINAYFSKNSSDFVVREIPLYEYSGSGEHLIVQIQKKGLSTFELLSILSSATGVRIRDFGYAGLKDKEGMTTQFISLPAKFESAIANFSYDNIKILNTTRHNNKLRIGHLKGNHFFIRLKKVLPSEAQKLKNAINLIDSRGFANYFGYQRFGKFANNYQNAKELLTAMANGDKKNLKKYNPKLRDFLISAYQGELFNRYLSKRVEISRFCDSFSIKELAEIYKFDMDTIKDLKSQKQFFKLIRGEVMGHYPFGKLFLCEDLSCEVEKFIQRDRTSCGLLLGSKAYEASGVAMQIERDIIGTEFIKFMNGSRRFNWVWADEMRYSYNEEEAQFSLSFTLQKGSYATTLLREILGREIFDFADL